jgi:hypothetical protein
MNCMRKVRQERQEGALDLPERRCCYLSSCSLGVCYAALSQATSKTSVGQPPSPIRPLTKSTVQPVSSVRAARMSVVQPVSSVRPLDEVTIISKPGGTLIVKDGRGRTYVRTPSASEVTIRAGGATGTQTVSFVDRAWRHDQTRHFPRGSQNRHCRWG